MSDALEGAIGTNACNNDSDGDGLQDGAETMGVDTASALLRLPLYGSDPLAKDVASSAWARVSEIMKREAIITTLLAGWLGLSCGAGTAARPDAGGVEPADAAPPDGMLPEPRCIMSWPSAPGSSPTASLPNVVPKVVWQKTVSTSGYVPELVLAGDKLAFTAGNRLVVLSRTSGEFLFDNVDAEAQLAAPPLADEAGNLYIASSSLRKIGADGSVLWTVPFGTNLSPLQETTSTSNLLLEPGGRLLFAATDGLLYAVASADGQVAWTRNVGISPSSQRALFAGGGIGDTAFFDGTPFRVSDGAPGPPFRADGQNLRAGTAAYAGLLGGYFSAAGIEGFLLDRCGEVLFRFPSGVFAFLVGFGDALIGWGDGTSMNGYVFSATGQKVVGPTPIRGLLSVLGADNTLYSVECAGDTLDTSTMTVLAYASDLTKVWEIPLGSPCSYGGAALADDGLLYVARPTPTGTEVIAIQTASPGLARTALPTRRNDNRRTGWLD